MVITLEKFMGGNPISPDVKSVDLNAIRCGWSSTSALTSAKNNCKMVIRGKDQRSMIGKDQQDMEAEHVAHVASRPQTSGPMCYRGTQTKSSTWKSITIAPKKMKN